MTHKCPTEPCEDCWDEAIAVGIVLTLLGFAVVIMWLSVIR